MEAPAMVFDFARSVGVARQAVQLAAEGEHPRGAAIELVHRHLSRRPLEATFTGSAMEGATEPFRIVRGRVFRSDEGQLSTRFTQLYADGESVCWSAKLGVSNPSLQLSPPVRSVA
jgi:hypothetical protein